MPFVVPPQQQQEQPEGQRRSDRGGYSAGRGGDINRQQYGPAYRQPQQQQVNPWEQQRQRPQQYRYQPAPQPQAQYRGPQRSQGAYGGYQPARMPNPYQPRPYVQQQQYMHQREQEPYMARPQRGYDQGGRQPMGYSNRPQQGNYVGEGVYADGTPMPPVSSSGFNGQSLVQTNGAPASGAYSAFAPTPQVNGGDIVPRPYFEEEDTYNKPMRVGRGGGSAY